MARKTVTIEIDEGLVDLLEAHAHYLMEMKDLAGSAPHGQVFDQCEDAVVSKGRELQRQLLERAVESRVEAAEKKGAAEAVYVRTGTRKSWRCGPLCRHDYR